MTLCSHATRLCPSAASTMLSTFEFRYETPALTHLLEINIHYDYGMEFLVNVFAKPLQWTNGCNNLSNNSSWSRWRLTRPYARPITMGSLSSTYTMVSCQTCSIHFSSPRSENEEMLPYKHQGRRQNCTMCMEQIHYLPSKGPINRVLLKRNKNYSPFVAVLISQWPVGIRKLEWIPCISNMYQ